MTAALTLAVAAFVLFLAVGLIAAWLAWQGASR